MANDKDKDKDKTAQAHADAVREAHAPQPSPAPDHGPAGAGGAHSEVIRPQQGAPSGSEGIVVTSQGPARVPGMPDPDYDPSVVPALSAYPDPNAPGDPNVTKDVSANAREARAVPVFGWVDHDITGSDGNLFPAHTPGVIMIQHHVPVDRDSTTDDPPASPHAAAKPAPAATMQPADDARARGKAAHATMPEIQRAAKK